MILSCPNCQTRFSVQAQNLGPAGRKVRCAKCSHVWLAQQPAAAAPPAVDPYPPPAPDPVVAPPPPRADTRQDAGRASRAAPSQARRRGGGPLAAFAWILLFIVVVGVAAGGYFARGWIVDQWPQAEHVYNWIGIPLPLIQVAETFEEPGVRDGSAVVTLGGVLVNNDDKPRQTSFLTYTLNDADGDPLRSWSIPPPVSQLGPGETAAFESVITRNSDAPLNWQVEVDRSEIPADLFSDPDSATDDSDGDDQGDDDHGG